LPPVVCLSFGRRCITDRFQQSDVVESVDPFQRRQLHRFPRFPWRTVVNQFRFVRDRDRNLQCDNMLTVSAALKFAALATAEIMLAFV